MLRGRGNDDGCGMRKSSIVTTYDGVTDFKFNTTGTLGLDQGVVHWGKVARMVDVALTLSPGATRGVASTGR